GRRGLGGGRRRLFRGGLLGGGRLFGGGLVGGGLCGDGLGASLVRALARQPPLAGSPVCSRARRLLGSRLGSGRLGGRGGRRLRRRRRFGGGLLPTGGCCLLRRRRGRWWRRGRKLLLVGGGRGGLRRRCGRCGGLLGAARRSSVHALESEDRSERSARQEHGHGDQRRRRAPPGRRAGLGHRGEGGAQALARGGRGRQRRGLVQRRARRQHRLGRGGR